MIHGHGASGGTLGSISTALATIPDAQHAMTRAVELLKERMPRYTWVGIYLVTGNELVLGPFRGKPSPHTTIPFGRGICGAAATGRATIIVDDVNNDPRYLACSIDTQSEIVVPIMRDGVLGEIDIDSDVRAAFGPDDRDLLEAIAAILSEKLVKHTITLIPGDGIGPEVAAAVVKILETAGLEVEWESHLAGMLALERQGSTLPAELLESIRRNKVALKGPVTTPIGQGFTSVNVGLRKALDLYANLRPVWNIPAVPSRYENIDLVIVRENTEDLYSGLEHEVVPGVVESLKIITERASTRIARFAFEHARKYGRKRVTAVHKANIMKMGDGLFLRCVKKVAAEYPDIQSDDRIVDAACMALVMNPTRNSTCW